MSNQNEKTDQVFTLDQASQKLALDQLRSGKSLFGKGGAFAPMLQQLLEAALEGEMAAHLQREAAADASHPNRRNGRTSKKLKTSDGVIELATPRDRAGSFEPQIVKKRETILADSLEERIIGMYGLGMSLRDISKHIEETYDTPISHTTLSEITDRIVPKVKEWQSRPLESVYPIVWLDAMYFKVKSEDSGRIVTRCLYNILGVRTDGHKEIIGTYVSESEGARFWLTVLTDLAARGVNDIFIACVDNLSGFEEAIVTVFPKTEVQSCIVHQVRNTHKYVAYKDSKAVMTAVKAIYKAATKEAAELELDAFESQWSKAYPAVVKSWRANWHKLSTFFAYPEAIRKVIYTTNTIEAYHRQVRKVTKTKGAFPSDMGLLKLVYLASRRIEAQWARPMQEWPRTAAQLHIIFGDRMPMMG
jgi:putative transposase